MRRLALLLIAVMIVGPAWAAPPEAKPLPLEARIQMLELELPRLRAEAAKQAKDEAEGVQKQLETKVDANTKLVEVQNSHMDQMLAGLGLLLALAAVVGWQTSRKARAEAREAAGAEMADIKKAIIEDIEKLKQKTLRKAQEQIAATIAKADLEIQALSVKAIAETEKLLAEIAHARTNAVSSAAESEKLLTEIADARTDAVSTAAEMKNHEQEYKNRLENLDIRPENWTAQQQADVNQAAAEAEQRPEDNRTAEDWSAMALRAMENGNYQQAAQWLERASIEQADDPWTWIYLSRLRRNQGNLETSHRAAKRAQTIGEDLLRTDPESSWARGALANALDEIGSIAQAQGSLTDARVAFTSAKDIREGLARNDPANNHWQRELSVSWNKIGDIAQAEGDLAAARLAYQSSKDIRERLTEGDPTNSQWQRDLFVSWSKLGEVFLAETNFREARDAFLKVRSYCEAILKIDPNRPQWRVDMAENDGCLGDVAAAEGHTAEAHEQWGRALAALEILEGEGRLDAYGRKLLEGIRGKLPAADFAGT